MFGIWRTCFSKNNALGRSSGFCFPRFRRSTQNHIRLENFEISNMGKKNKKKGSSGLSANARLTALQGKGNPENLNRRTTKGNLIPPKVSINADPWKTVLNFYQNLSITNPKKGMITMPTYATTVLGKVECVISVKYPKITEIRCIGNSKKDALKKCSNKILKFLENNNINWENYYNIPISTPIDNVSRLISNFDNFPISTRNEIANEVIQNRKNSSILTRNVEDFYNSPPAANTRLAVRKRQQQKEISALPEEKMDLILFPSSVDLNAWKTLSTFYSTFKKKLKNHLILTPEYKYKKPENSIECTLKVTLPSDTFPTDVILKSQGKSKKECRNICAEKVLQFFQQTNIDLKKPNFNHINSGLFDTETIFKKLEQCKIADDVKVVRDYTKMNSLDLNRNVTTIITNLMNQRNFSTCSSLQIRGELSENKGRKPDEMKPLKLSQSPKSIIVNYYTILSNYLDEDFKPTSSYTHLKENCYSYPWACTYVIKWPEKRTFVKLCSTKKSAVQKACLEVMKYLDSLKLIDSYGRPILNEELTKKHHKETYKIISLKQSTIDKLNKISDIYKTKLLNNLMTTIDSVSDSSIDETEGLFSNYSRMKKHRKPDFYSTNERTTLPVSKFKNDIIEAVKNNQVVVVKGEPGCGKSTRIPQYVMEGWAKGCDFDQNFCRIVVTQPRRIAAISLAERVASERDENVGESIGYQVRLQNSFSSKLGRILYCTTGILLRKMQANPNLTDCSHVILDEAHERDVNTDLLMNLLRTALVNNPNLKLIVMSATIDTGIFQEYFQDASVFHIPGFTYPVRQHFIDQCSSIDFSKTLDMCEGKNPTVVNEDVVKLIEYIHSKRGEGAILCFLPGWDDIKNIYNTFENHPTIHALCLHSRLSMREQKMIFSKAPHGKRKLILSTNIAETSVTINDVVYVIDTGIQKETKFDSSKGVTCLDNSWISQANVQQRKGRAGRCQPGESFHLYSKEKFKEFAEFPIPEIRRTSLTKIVLDGKVYSNNMNAVKFLGQLITPPSNAAVQLAVQELTDLELLNSNEDLTPLGRTLANFQLEPKLAKTMVNALIFKCVTPIVDIVTLFSEETELFSVGLYAKEQIKTLKRKFSKTSDHLALMKMFEQWLEYVEIGHHHEARSFCINNNLVEAKLLTLQKLREIHFGYLEKYPKSFLPISDDLSNNDELVKGVLLSGVGTLLEHSEQAKGKKKKHILRTRNNHNAMITSGSVNSKLSSYLSDYLIYVNEMVSNVRKTSVIRETSLVSLLTVLLFKNNNIILEELPESQHSSDINTSDQVLLILENTKHKYICDKQEAEAIKLCKETLTTMLQYYVFVLTHSIELDRNVNKEWDRILRVLNEILEEVQI